MSNREKLWEFLINNPGWHTSSELALVVGVTSRTIKTYLHDSPKDLNLTSSNKGYMIDSKNSNLKSLKKDNVQTIHQIERYLLSDKKSNIMDLSIELYLSESSINKNLTIINDNIKKFGLSIERSGDNVSLIGTEAQKRKLISSLLYEESNGSFLSQNMVNENFPNIDYAKIKQAIEENVNKYNVYLNTFDVNNILLHLLIAIQRISSGHVMSKHINNMKPNEKLNVVSAILYDVENVAKISFPSNDWDELSTVINYSVSRWHKDLVDKVSQESIDLVNELIEYVWSIFNVNLNNSSFKTQFTIHLDRVLKRSRTNKTIHNPMVQKIKTSSPTIYECAVLMAHLISQKAKVTLDDNEIAFIAMHIGNAIAEQNSTRDKLKVVILMPDYQGSMYEIVNRIKKEFQNSIVIEDVIEEPALQNIPNDIDLVVEINSDYDIKNINHLVISPFLVPSDIANLKIKIATKQHEIKKKRFQKSLMSFFDKQNFIFTNSINDRNQIFDMVTKKFVDEKIVDSNFKDNLINRENMSSTAFGRFAVPHSFNMNANKSNGFIVINNKGIGWTNNSEVYLVIVLAVDPNNKSLFREVFDDISEIMIEPANLSKLLKCKTYEQFIVQLTELI